MKIGIDFGHSLSGAGCGAVGLISETEKNRLVGNRLIQLLKTAGHTVVNCTVDYANSTNAQLSGIVNKANAQSLDLFISIHLNAGGGNGTETFVHTSAGASTKNIATRINNSIANSCNFTNRGLKTATYYVLRSTNAPAILTELCFVDSSIDAGKWNTEKIAVAMFEAITNTSYSAPSASTVGDSWVKRLQQEIVNQGYGKISVDGIAGSETLKSCPILKLGSKGNLTKLLQERLVTFGYSTNGVDGDFGNGTKNAVILFQKANNLSADGIVGQGTWKKILKI